MRWETTYTFVLCLFFFFLERKLFLVSKLKTKAMKKLLKNLIYGTLFALPFSASAQTSGSSGPVVRTSTTIPQDSTGFPGDTCTLSVSINNDAPVITRCFGPQCSNLTAIVSGGTPPYSYAWSSGHTTSTISVCHNTTAQFIVLVSDSNGCTATASTTVEVIDACCEGTNVIVCYEDSTLCVDSADVTSYLIYGGTIGPCPSAQARSVTAMVKNAGSHEGLRVYPNPFSQSIVFEMELKRSGHVKIEVMDVAGKKVAEINNSVPAAGIYRFNWNGNNAAGTAVTNGLYFCRIISGDTMHNMKIQKLSDK